MEITSLVTAVAAQQAQTRTSIEAAMLKQNAKDDQAVVGLLADAAAATPAPGTGTLVDKTV